MKKMNDEVVIVYTTTGKTKKWWGTHHVAKSALEEFKTMMTADLREYCIKPTTTINFEVFEEKHNMKYSTSVFVDGFFRSVEVNPKEKTICWKI